MKHTPRTLLPPAETRIAAVINNHTHTHVHARARTRARTRARACTLTFGDLWRPIVIDDDSHMRMRILLVPELHHRSGCKADRIDHHY